MSTKDLIGKVVSGYQIEEKIGSGAYGTVYKVSKVNESGQYIYALKHITIPNGSEYKDILSSMCGDYGKANQYFKGILDDIINEIKILRSLSEKNNANIVGYYDNDIEKQDQPLRYDIFLRMEYLTPLSHYLLENQITTDGVIQLGLDVLSALELCHTNNVIHRDIKEDNIFITKDKRYKLGDFGIAKALKEKSRAASMKGTPAYIAPEVYIGKEEYNKSVDLYSLGIVLYRLLNHNRYPFVKPYPLDFDMDDVETAIDKRLTGEIPELPTNAPHILGQVIRKAISEKEARFKTATEFHQALCLVREQLSMDERGKILNKDLIDNVNSMNTIRPEQTFKDATNNKYNHINSRDTINHTNNNNMDSHQKDKPKHNTNNNNSSTHTANINGMNTFHENQDYAKTVGAFEVIGKNQILNEENNLSGDKDKHRALFESQGYTSQWEHVEQDKQLNRNSIKYYTVGVTEIGIVGVSSGVGVTHTAIMFANILCPKYKVALFELNDSGVFNEIKKIVDPKNNHHYYTHNTIDYFTGMEYTDFVAHYKESYDYVIVDFGSYYDMYDINDFIRTDVRLVVGQAIDWKQREIRNFHQSTQQYDPKATWNYLIPFLGEADIEDVRNMNINNIYTIPFNKNPFSPSKGVDVAFYTIFNSILGIDNKGKKKKSIFNVF